MPVKQISFIMLLTVLCGVLAANTLWDDAIPIRQGVNIEWFRTGTDTPDGAAIYVWSDTKLGERDLWAQKVSATGQMLWNEPVLIDGKPDRQEDPVITRTSDNNYIIAWIDFSNDLDGNVYAQKIDGNGQRMWQDGGVPVCDFFAIQIGLNIEPDADGGAYIVWGDSRNPSKDLYAQRLSSTGAPVWTANGIPVANGVGDEIQNTMFPDGQGGLMIAYTHSYVGNDDIYVKRFLPAGTMAWTQPLLIASGAGNQNSVRMAPLGNGEFALIWKNQPAVDDNIYGQKINLQGQLMWPDPFVVIDDSATTAAPQLNPRIVATSDHGVIVVWEDFRLDNQNPDLFAQKISNSGSLLWAAGGVNIADAPFGQYSPRLAADNNGGAYMVWDDTRNGNAPNYDIYAQHINGSGTALWTAGGLAVCTAPHEQSGSLIKVANNNIFINWMDIRNGSVGIYYQVLNTAGATQLADNGVEVFWGLSGDTPLQNYHLLPRSTDVVAIWQDTRFANIGYQIYFQIVNPDNTVALETNGRPVTVSVGAEQLTPQGVVTPDGHIAIVWEDKRNANPKIYAQLISPTGERLWGDTGLEMTDESPLRQMEPKISYVDGAFYIGWSGLVYTNGLYVYQVFGQKIQNNQKQWGPNGILISDLGTIEGIAECTISDIVDTYYVWERVNSLGDPRIVYVKRMQANGTPYAGWPNDGIRASSYSNYDAMQFQAKSVLTNNGIFIAWKDIRTDFILNYYGQILSPTGERLWNDEGVSLADNSREQEFAALNSDPSGVTVVWAENINGMHDIMASKYSLTGNPLWNALGNYVVQIDSTQTNPTIARFANSGLVAAWSDYTYGESDIYYNYIRNNGSLIYPGAGLVLCDVAKFQYEPIATTVGTAAYVMWADGRSSGKTEILGLYMHKVGNEDVAICDPGITSPAAFRLIQNYPNPFNPTTTISFEIQESRPDYNLSVYNNRGQLVKSLHRGELTRGNHSLVWDGKDDNGNNVSSGVYYYKLSSRADNQIRKMVLVK